MKLKDFRQTKMGKFLSSYELTYMNKEGKEKVYEMVSRESNLSALSVGKRTAGVAVAGFMYGRFPPDLLTGMKHRSRPPAGSLKRKQA